MGELTIENFVPVIFSYKKNNFSVLHSTVDVCLEYGVHLLINNI